MSRRPPYFFKDMEASFPKDKSSELECFANKKLAKPILIVKYPICCTVDILTNIANKVEDYTVIFIPSKKVDDIEFEVLNG